ncbi:hypothetical protein Hanom_Chr11g00974891 [Helianthus anomalus]
MIFLLKVVHPINPTNIIIISIIYYQKSYKATLKYMGLNGSFNASIFQLYPSKYKPHS